MPTPSQVPTVANACLRDRVAAAGEGGHLGAVEVRTEGDPDDTLEGPAAAVLLPAAPAARTRRPARRAPPGCARTRRPCRRRRAPPGRRARPRRRCRCRSLTSRNDPTPRTAPTRARRRSRSCASLSSTTGRPTAPRAGPRTGASRQGRWAANRTVSPAVDQSGRRHARPRPAADRRRPSSARGPARPRPPRPGRRRPGVESRAVRSTSPASATSTASTFVPPTSTPTCTSAPRTRQVGGADHAGPVAELGQPDLRLRAGSPGRSAGRANAFADRVEQQVAGLADAAADHDHRRVEHRDQRGDARARASGRARPSLPDANGSPSWAAR